MVPRPRIVLLASLITTVVALAGPAVVAVPVDAGHVDWIHDGYGFITQVGTIDANGDGTPDVMAGAGDRTDGYVQCLVPPGGPWPQVSRLLDTILRPTPGIAMLDGETGEPLWRTDWNTGGPIGATEGRGDLEVLERAVAGDLDGDGAGDLLVLRSTYLDGGTGIEQRLEMLDAANGSVRWSQEGFSDAPIAVRAFEPSDVLGEPGGVLMSLEILADLTIRGDARLVRLPPGAPPETVFAFPIEAGSFGAPIPVPIDDDHMRLVGFEARLIPPPNPALEVDLTAADLRRDPETGELSLEEAWARPNVNGVPVVTGGDDPAVFVGHDQITAYDLDDGSVRWTNPVDVGLDGGTMIAADVTGDGVDDAITSPAFGTPLVETGLASGLLAEVAVIDGTDGGTEWAHRDALAKFRAWRLDVGDVDADGGPEIIGSMTTQDGFATCSQPADDPGTIAVWDAHTGSIECRFPTDRWSSRIASVDLDGEPGDEVVAATIGGRVYSFTAAEPGCGTLGDP